MFPLGVGQCQAQTDEKYRIIGIVKKATTGEPMADVTVSVSEAGKGATTDEKGRYTIFLSAGTYEINFSYVGFQTVVKRVRLNENMNVEVAVNASLSEIFQQLEQVDVSEMAADKNISEAQMGM